eukprot:10581624-Lingulodinium_polyedra.AAC.1
MPEWPSRAKRRYCNIFFCEVRLPVEQSAKQSRTAARNRTRTRRCAALRAKSAHQRPRGPA